MSSQYLMAITLALATAAYSGTDTAAKESDARADKKLTSATADLNPFKIGHLTICKQTQKCSNLAEMANVIEYETITKIQENAKLLNKSYKDKDSEAFLAAARSWIGAMDSWLAAMKALDKPPRYIAYGDGLRNSMKMFADQREKYDEPNTDELTAFFAEHHFANGFINVSKEDWGKYGLLRKRPGR